MTFCGCEENYGATPTDKTHFTYFVERMPKFSGVTFTEYRAIVRDVFASISVHTPLTFSVAIDALPDIRIGTYTPTDPKKIGHAFPPSDKHQGFIELSDREKWDREKLVHSLKHEAGHVIRLGHIAARCMMSATANGIQEWTQLDIDAMQAIHGKANGEPANLRAVVNEFLGEASKEIARELWPRSGRDKENFVRLMFLQVLKREPEPSAITHWVGRMK